MPQRERERHGAVLFENIHMCDGVVYGEGLCVLAHIISMHTRLRLFHIFLYAVRTPLGQRPFHTHITQLDCCSVRPSHPLLRNCGNKSEANTHRHTRRRRRLSCGKVQGFLYFLCSQGETKPKKEKKEEKKAVARAACRAITRS